MYHRERFCICKQHGNTSLSKFHLWYGCRSCSPYLSWLHDMKCGWSMWLIRIFNISGALFRNRRQQYQGKFFCLLLETSLSIYGFLGNPKEHGHWKILATFSLQHVFIWLGTYLHLLNMEWCFFWFSIYTLLDHMTTGSEDMRQESSDWFELHNFSAPWPIRRLICALTLGRVPTTRSSNDTVFLITSMLSYLYRIDGMVYHEVSHLPGPFQVLSHH